MVRHAPTLITISRIFLAFGIGALLILPDPPMVRTAAVLFAITALSDAFDGWLARRLDAVTDLGARLDPIADKALLATTLLGMISGGLLSGLEIFAASLILSRETAVATLRMVAGPSPSLAVTALAKWKTALQMAAIGALLFGVAFSQETISAAGTILLWTATGLTLYTGLIYLMAYLSQPGMNGTGRKF